MSELYHYGVLGMHWGVRRYRNDDGSLTDKGKKHYTNRNPNKVRNEMQKKVEKQRVEVHGLSYKYQRGKGIGINSTGVENRRKRDYEKWTSSKEYKDAAEQAKKIEDLYKKGKIHSDQYSSMTMDAWKKANKSNPNKTAYAIRGSKREYLTKSYPDKHGKELTIAYLKDLGYNDDSSQFLQQIIRRSNKKVLD